MVLGDGDKLVVPLLQAWFGADYDQVASEVPGQSSFDLFLPRLEKSPGAVLSSPLYPWVDATGVEVCSTHANKAAGNEVFTWLIDELID